MTTQVSDNLLFTVASNFDTLDRLQLNTLLLKSYNFDEFLSSKTILINECEKIDTVNYVCSVIEGTAILLR